MSKLLVKVWVMIVMAAMIFIFWTIYQYEEHGLEQASDFVLTMGLAAFAYWRGYKLGVARNE